MATGPHADLMPWHSLFEQSPGFVFVLRGPHHTFDYGNARAAALIGWDRVPVGSAVATVLPEVAAQGYVDMLDEVFATGTPYTASASPVVLGGQHRFVDFVCQPIREEGGAITGILVQGFDATDRERAESHLRESSARLRLATAAAQLGIHEWHIASGRLLWDERMRALWGVPADEEITYETFIAGVVEDDRARTQAAVELALSPSGGGVYAAEYRVRDRRGTVRWVRATGHVEFHGAAPTRLVGTVQDITREKDAEEELLEADRRKDLFLATLAHELRNPLAPISNAAQILAQPGIGPREVAWAQQVITRQASHMASLLDDLLDVARLTQGRLDLKREPCEIRAVIDAAVETVQPQLSSRRHQLTLDVPSDSLPVFGDPLRLCQVFVNLLANAIKYTDSGGRIGVVVARAARTVRITVSDSGIGMAPAALSEVFGMFRQSASALERAEGGIGIGLAIARAIVELHGGTIAAASDGPGHGSTFTVTLPLHGESPSRVAPAAAVAVVPRTGRRIVMADDNRDAVETLRILLGMHGHEVYVATNGLAVLQLMTEVAPDVILLDIGMPRMNGYEVAQAIRQRDDGATVRLIALTGWGQADDRIRAFEAGFDAHLTKPPDTVALLAEVSR